MIPFHAIWGLCGIIFFFFSKLWVDFGKKQEKCVKQPDIVSKK